MSRLNSLVTAVAALLVSASALAWGWQEGTRLTLVSSNGTTIVGLGVVGDDALDLTITEGFSGFGVLVVEQPDGELVTFDVIVEADGSILVGEHGDFEDLRAVVADEGLALELVRERPAVSAGAPPADGRNRGLDAAGNARGRAGRAAERAEDATGNVDEHAGERAVGRAEEAPGRVEEVAGDAADEATRRGRAAGRAAGGEGAGVDVGVGVEGGTDADDAGAGPGVGIGAGGRGGGRD